MWLGKQHKEALDTLKYGVLDNEGFLFLTGDVGTGKTTLINALILSLANDIIHTAIPDPNLSSLDFLNYIASSFGIEQEFTAKETFFEQFRKFLVDAHDNGKKVLLIIDESQLLSQEVLEEIQLLSNISKANKKMINIFFVGQNELIELLRQKKNRAIRKKLTLNYSIGPLTPDETDTYIKHRLKVAGATHAIFKPEAVQEVFMYSGGFPRRINVICDHALLTGYVTENKIIGADIISGSAKELKIPEYVKNRDIKGFESHTPEPISNDQPQSTDLKTNQPEKKQNEISMILTGFIILVVLSIFLLVIFPISFQSKETDDPAPVKNITHQREKLYLETAKQNDFDKDKLSPVKEKPQDAIQSMQTPSGNSEKNVSTDSSKQSKKGKKNIPLPEGKIIVRFKYNANTLNQEAYTELNDFADLLIMHPDTKVFIAGYTDSNGYQEYNVRLSESRASIVKSFLLGKGVDPGQIELKGFGSLNPLESNQTSWGRMMNRRVEIKVIK